MSTVINIPQANLRAPFSTGSVPNSGFTAIQLLVNRNVGQHPIDGFAAGSAVLSLLVEHSEDGGTTWLTDFGGDVPGGVIIDHHTGTELLVSQITADGFIPGQPVRATVTPLQGTVSVSGTLTLS